MTTLCLFSGGLDSTVLLYELASRNEAIGAVSILYGQRHKREVRSARLIARLLDINHIVIDLSALAGALSGASSQIGQAVPVPEGHYSAENMRTTVVPNRNMILLAAAAGIAIANGYERVAYAAHAGDHAIYPDCRPAFAQAMKEALALAHEPPVMLHAPFLYLSKAELVAMGHVRGVPFAETWSCYKGEEVHCGRCGTCVERREAFAIAGIDDPTEYSDATYWEEACAR